jgi:hypothetical protein
MTNSSTTRHRLVALVGLLLWAGASADIDPRTGRAGGDAAARSFAEYCEGELPAARQQRFYTELESAERALAAGDLAVADAARGRAWEAAYRGGADNDLAVKCLGQATAQRWLDMRLGIYRLQAGQAGDKRVGLAALYVTAADEGADALVRIIGAQPVAGFRASLTALEEIVARLDAERAFGTYLLPAEDRVEQACRAAIPPLRGRAGQAHTAALAAEDQAFNRSATDAERSAAASMGNAEALAGAFAGLALDTQAEQEAMLTGIRIRESQDHLRDASLWNLERYDDPTARPAAQRARQRGESLLAMAEDGARSLRSRDAFYRDARWYFDFGGFAAQAESVAARRAAIQPALEAEQAERERQLERVRAETERRAESAQQAVEGMRKSEAEQQSFREEADALEAELGF